MAKNNLTIKITIWDNWESMNDKFEYIYNILIEINNELNLLQINLNKDIV